MMVSAGRAKRALPQDVDLGLVLVLAPALGALYVARGGRSGVGSSLGALYVARGGRSGTGSSPGSSLRSSRRLSGAGSSLGALYVARGGRSGVGSSPGSSLRSPRRPFWCWLQPGSSLRSPRRPFWYWLQPLELSTLYVVRGGCLVLAPAWELST